jgi:hypothetical protein
MDKQIDQFVYELYDLTDDEENDIVVITVYTYYY